jgi:hypothetical protein
MKRSITIPQTLNDITLKQWMEYVTLEDPSDERLVSLFCNVNGKELLELPNRVYAKAVEGLSTLIQSIGNKQNLVTRFTLGGVNYGMIPNLDDITYGENKDLLAMIGDWKNMDKAMAVLFRPITKNSLKTYEIEEYKGVDNAIYLQHMPLDIVFAAQLFFYTLTKELLHSIPNYLEREIAKPQTSGTTQVQITKENGEAMMKHIASLRETLRSLTR